VWIQGHNEEVRAMTFRLFLLVGLYFHSSLLQAEQYTLTGQVTSSNIVINLQVSGIATTVIPDQTKLSAILALVNISLGNRSGQMGTQGNTNPVLQNQTDPTKGRNQYFYVDPSSTVTTTTMADGSLQATYTIYVNPNPNYQGALSSVYDPGSTPSTVTANVQFNGSPTWQTAALTVLFSKPAQATTCAAPVGQNRAIAISCPTSIAPVNNTKGTTQRVTNYTMLAIPNSFSGHLDGKTVDNTAGNDVAVDCDFDPSSLPSCLACGDKGYVLAKQSDPSISSVTFAVAAGLGHILSLTPNEEYTLIYQYENSTVSTCAKAEPIITYLLSELELDGTANGAPSEGDPRCFVVSATYGKGSTVADTFRWGRDRFLLPFAWGQALMDWYYAASEPFAQYLTTAPVTRSVIYGALLVPAGLLWVTKSIYGLSAVEGGLFILLLVGVSFVVSQGNGRKRRR